MLNSSRLFLSIFVMALAASFGCGDRNWGHVTGTIRLNGEPVGPGTITFEQANPESMMAPSAAATFRSDGRYTLHSPGNKPGAPAGEYVVRIQGHSEDWTGDESFDADISTSVPAKYNDPRASGLTATVEPGNQTIDFDLEP